MRKTNNTSQRLVILSFIAIGSISTGAFGQGAEPNPPCVTADAELNRVYKQVRRAYKDDSIFMKKLTLAQRAWIKFRDAHMESRYPVNPKEEERTRYGSIFGQCHCAEVAELTKARVKQLRKWPVGVEEGEGCSGSYKWDHQLR